MPVIHLRTEIAAPRERVFDLARSVDLHMESTPGTGERAVDGVTSGLVGLDDEIVWEARHFGVRQRLAVRITAFERPLRFEDTMLRGAFARMRHDHEFVEAEQGTTMIDRLDFASPLGWLGRLVDAVVMERYMRSFLLRRNAVIQRVAESDEWRRYVPSGGASA